MTCCLPPDTPPALAAIVAGPIAWSMTADLAAKGIELAALIGLADAGLVHRWAELDAWTLSGYGAATLKVVITEHGSGCVPRWGDADREPAPTRLAPGHRSRPFDFAAVPDPAPPPGSEPEPYLDPESGAPLVLFGGRATVYVARGTGWHRRAMHRSLAS